MGVLSLGIHSAASAGDVKTPPQFNVCKATFALCTVAACDPIPGTPDQVTSHEGSSVNSFSADGDPR
jgi:hypothetical protein